MSKSTQPIHKSDDAHGTLFDYALGFILSIALTLIAYHLVTQRVNNPDIGQSNTVLIAQIIVLAFVQFIVQLVFFLHLGRGKYSRSNQLVLFFMVFVVSVLVVGSLWIMANLDYSHVQSDANTEKSIIEDEGAHQ